MRLGLMRSGLLAGTLLLAACSAQKTLSSPSAAAPAVTPVYTPTAAPPVSPSTAAAPPLTTSSGFRLDAPSGRAGLARSLAPDLSPDSGLQTIRAPKGAEVLSPVGWQSLAPASLAQQICVSGSCVQVQEEVLVLMAPDKQESIAVFGVDVPVGVSSGGAVLDDLVRGVIAGFTTSAPDTRIIEGPSAIVLPGAAQASALRATFIQPATGRPATIFVEAASQGQRVGGVMIMTPDDYLKSHQDDIDRIRSSFRLGVIAN